MKLGDRLNHVLAQMIVADPGGATVSCNRPRLANVHGKRGLGRHGATSTAPSASRSLAQAYAEHIGRLLDVAEHDLACMKGTTPRPDSIPKRGPKSALAAGRKRRIVGDPLYRERAAEFVAFIENSSADLVLEARGEKRLDAYRLPKPTPLTAPPGKATAS